ncbi:MAG: small nuclear ribonucleoprotein [Thermoplasmata archaeon HGW-Thermoplasmata-1]|nr:MAG: small nuclear ribonucleoprotein [Thermoplasmata archaeon HGW-Thermoplasmata-1]
MAKRPLDILHASLNGRVVVELRGGREYRGTLEGYDHPHMNVVLKNVEELHRGNTMRKLGNVIVRGDSIIYISP